MIFDVAPADAHAVTAAALKAAGAHVPRACLLRRVVADYAASPSFQTALAAGGLRGDRLSVWALQVGEAPIICIEAHGTSSPLQILQQSMDVIPAGQALTSKILPSAIPPLAICIASVL